MSEATSNIDRQVAYSQHFFFGGSVESEYSRGLAAFVRHLNSNPAPDSVARALVLGALAPFGARSGGILVHEGDELRVVADHASEGPLLARYSVLPLTVDVPYTRAYLREETLVTTRTTLLEDFPALAVDSPLWGAGQGEDHVAELVSVPISHQGVRCGVFGFITRAQREWTLSDFVMLEGISALIGLWMTHPASGIPGPVKVGRMPSEDDTLHLSQRQLAILSLVAQDKTNESIAAHLQVSVSTVKLEIQRLLRALRSDDRHGAVAHARALGLLAATDP